MEKVKNNVLGSKLPLEGSGRWRRKGLNLSPRRPIIVPEERKVHILHTSSLIHLEIDNNLKQEMGRVGR
jgi:hypothetical protein